MAKSVELKELQWKNTFATSAYIATSPENAFNYLCSLENLDEWTLFSRMIEQIIENIYGTASGHFMILLSR